MTKAEKNAQIQTAIEAFLLSGGQITKVEPKKIKVKMTCHGHSSRANTGGGQMPTFRISSLYQQGVAEETQDAGI